MKYQSPFRDDLPAVDVALTNNPADAPYVNGDPSVGREGSIPPAAAFEQHQRELLELITWSGQTPSNNDLTQVRKAIQWAMGQVGISDDDLTIIQNLIDVKAFSPSKYAVLFVRPDGNDLNDGSANDAAHAFRTIRAACNFLQTVLLTPGSTHTIKLGIAGTYESPGNIVVPGINLVIQGDAAAQASYIISGAPISSNDWALVCAAGTRLRTIGLTIANTGNAQHAAGSVQGGHIDLETTTLTATSSPGWALLSPSGESTVMIYPGCIFGGSAVYAWLAYGTVTLNGAVTFAAGAAFAATVAASSGGRVDIWGTSTIGGATPTGYRYISQNNAVIDTAGRGVNFFPGTIAGITAVGGCYV